MCVTLEASSKEAIHKRSNKGKTPLFLAVEKGLIENASFLLDKGGSPSERDNEEDTLLVAGK